MTKIAAAIQTGDRSIEVTEMPMAMINSRQALPRRRGAKTQCQRALVYGFTPLDVGAGLWGGFAEYMVLDGNTILHRLSPTLSIEDAVLFNPLSAGFDWLCSIGGAGPGDTVVISGPGQRGMATVVAAREVGARLIIVAGTGRDAVKLDICRDLGADVTVNVDTEDLETVVDEHTDGLGADIFLDVAAFSPEPVRHSLTCVRRGGTVVLAALKGMKAVPDFVSDLIVLRALTVRGAMAVQSPAFDTAIRVLESDRYPALSRMHTHTLPITRLDEAIRLQGGELAESAIHVTIAGGRTVAP
jgi:threonine dehydrogenase-like Zn-dependent dehydrogenase